MDGVPDGLVPESLVSPPLSRPGEPESENRPQDSFDQRKTQPHWDDSNHSDDLSNPALPNPSTDDLEIGGHDDGCDDMVEKWRSIRLADRNRMEKKTYPTHGVHTALFGQNYSKFYEAFQQGLSSPQARTSSSKTVKAKRSAVASESAPKRRRRDDRASHPHSDQQQSITIPVQQYAATTAGDLRAANATEYASTSDIARESPMAPRPRSYADAKEPRSQRKGVGLYAGNWEYVTDEETVPEYLNVAQKTVGLEGRTTRRAYAKLTSKETGGDFSNFVGVSSRNRVRKPGRARSAEDYTRLHGPEGNAQDVAIPKQIEQDNTSSAQLTKQTSPSTSASSTSDRSTLMPDHPSRSTSTSTAMITEQPERPKLSWNAIVYEILATAELPLTFPQLMQGIRERFPFFNSPSQDKVLNSGVKNPLYFHEAFCKGEIIDGKQTWGLKPGEFVDKKTGKVLTPKPRHTISSHRLTEPVHETEHHSALESRSELSHPYNPRSGNPRFGREILNSPEIPDSQDAKAAISGPLGVDSRTATDHAVHLDERTGAQELANASDGVSAIASVGTSPSGQSSHSCFQWPTTTFSPINSSSASTSPTVAYTKVQHPQILTGRVDLEASAIAAHPISARQATHPLTSSIPPSTGESGHDSNSKNTQVASKSVPLVRAISPTYVPSSPGDRAAFSQAPSATPAAPVLSVASLAYPQLDLFLPEGKTGPKEHAYV